MSVHLRYAAFLFVVLLTPAKSTAAQGAVGDPEPAGKSSSAKAIDWLRANNAFGPKHRIVGEMGKKLARELGADQGFLWRLGSGLVKSGKQTWLGGWGGELFVFELTPAQDKAAPLAANTYSFTTVVDKGGRGQQEVALSAPKLDNADALDLTKPITGSVAVKLLGKKKGLRGQFGLRLVYVADGVRVSANHMHRSEYLIPGGKPMAFKFISPKKSGVTKHTGPLIVFLDLVRSPGGVGGVAISNPLVLLLNVGGTKEGKE